MDVENLILQAIGKIPAGALIELRAPAAPSTLHVVALNGEAVADFSSPARARSVAERLAKENPGCCLILPIQETFQDLGVAEREGFSKLIAMAFRTNCN